MTIHEIAGNEYIKRAIEIALVGNHSIAIIDTFKSSANNLLDALTDMGRKNNLKFSGGVFPSCPCKCFNTHYHECNCEVEELNLHFYNLLNQIKDFDMVVISYEENEYAFDNIAKNEHEEQIVVRVRNCIKSDIVVSPDLSRDCVELLEQAIKQYPAINKDKVVKLASTICKMEYRSVIEMCHLVEAIQYNLETVCRHIKW